MQRFLDLKTARHRADYRWTLLADVEDPSSVAVHLREARELAAAFRDLPVGALSDAAAEAVRAYEARGRGR